jgi:O-antigen ligase
VSSRLRLQVEGGLQALVFLVVLSMTFMTSHLQPWNLPEVRRLRWFALAELGVLALALLVIRPRPQLRRFPPLLVTGLLAALALVSAFWAADLRISLARAASFAFLLLVTAAIAVGVRGDPVAAGRIVLAILAAIATIALAGLVELWHSPDQAILSATRGRGARYNGIGENPNQVAMLLALALPLVLWAYTEVRSRWSRVAVVCLGLLLHVSLVASGSRGAVIAAFAGCLAFALFALSRRRLIAVAALVALFGASLLATQLPPESETDPVLYEEFGVTPPLAPQDVNGLLPLESEIGFPRAGATPVIRSKLVFSSGRREAWQGAVEQAVERPLLGYGFGMEERAFVDRYYLFVSSRVENSFLAMLLQLGPLGAVLLVLAIAVVVGAWLRARTTLREHGRRVAAACGGIVASGVGLAVTQSYLTSVGSPPAAPFWIALFLLGAISSQPSRSLRDGKGDEREHDAAQRHPEPRLDVVRREHDAVRAEQDERADGGSAADDRERRTD